MDFISGIFYHHFLGDSALISQIFKLVRKISSPIGTVYPDFTFLSRKTNAYENNGIFPGERLILTCETEQTILNTNKIEQLVNRYNLY